MTAIGLMIPEMLSTQAAVELGVSLERAGFDTAWFTEVDREPFVRSAASSLELND